MGVSQVACVCASPLDLIVCALASLSVGICCHHFSILRQRSFAQIVLTLALVPPEGHCPLMGYNCILLKVCKILTTS